MTWKKLEEKHTSKYKNISVNVKHKPWILFSINSTKHSFVSFINLIQIPKNSKNVPLSLVNRFQVMKSVVYRVYCRRKQGLIA